MRGRATPERKTSKVRGRVEREAPPVHTTIACRHHACELRRLHACDALTHKLLNGRDDRERRKEKGGRRKEEGERRKEKGGRRQEQVFKIGRKVYKQNSRKMRLIPSSHS